MSWFDAPDPDAPVHVLTVCIGNICRSPLAEQLLRAKLGSPYVLGSAGLFAAHGHPMDPLSAERSLRYGGNPEGAVGEQLTDEHAQWAHLILTMTQSQRDELVQRHPRAALRTFTLAEFAALAERTMDGDPAPRARISRATGARGSSRLSREDDVPDPINASVEVHDRVAAQIAGYVDRIVAALR
ncbi:MAG TPA: hypothetical protein PKE40_02295 [Arachnia sp.]|nr:hypothetical protein [Arachnia sp.]HMT85160.1 hypothetical protein [Arachnia sp.]